MSRSSLAEITVSLLPYVSRGEWYLFVFTVTQLVK